MVMTLEPKLLQIAQFTKWNKCKLVQFKALWNLLLKTVKFYHQLSIQLVVPQ